MRHVHLRRVFNIDPYCQRSRTVGHWSWFQAATGSSGTIWIESIDPPNLQMLRMIKDLQSLAALHCSKAFVLEILYRCQQNKLELPKAM